MVTPYSIINMTGKPFTVTRIPHLKSEIAQESQQVLSGKSADFTLDADYALETNNKIPTIKPEGISSNGAVLFKKF